jgi:hypothetical protein
MSPPRPGAPVTPEPDHAPASSAAPAAEPLEWQRAGRCLGCGNRPRAGDIYCGPCLVKLEPDQARRLERSRRVSTPARLGTSSRPAHR